VVATAEETVQTNFDIKELREIGLMKDRETMRKYLLCKDILIQHMKEENSVLIKDKV